MAHDYDKMILDYLFQFIQAMIDLFWTGKKSLSNTLNVYIKSSSGNTLSVALDPKWDIKNVKEVIAPKLGLNPEEVKIIFAGKELEDSIVIEVSFGFKLLYPSFYYIFFNI